MAKNPLAAHVDLLAATITVPELLRLNQPENVTTLFVDIAPVVTGFRN